MRPGIISTKEIPGVYNTPYLPAELKPQVYNADIEEHLKSVFKKFKEFFKYFNNIIMHPIINYNLKCVITI